MARMADTERVVWELRARIAALEAEVSRLAEHSVQLNALGWRLAEAVGDVGPADDRVYTDPAERMARLERLIRERDQAKAERDKVPTQPSSDLECGGNAATDVGNDARVRAAEPKPEPPPHPFLFEPHPRYSHLCAHQDGWTRWLYCGEVRDHPVHQVQRSEDRAAEGGDDA